MAPNASVTHRSLGGLAVSAVGLGLMPLSGVYGGADDAASEALIRHAIERGVDHLDSSDMHGWGHNEELLGRAIKGLRDRVVVVTKFGQFRRDGQANGVDGRPEYVAAACEASLRRLGVEVIDLYCQHRVDPAVPVEETVGAMARLVEQRKVRSLGLSEARPETIRRAHAVHPIAAVQTEYSLLYRAEAEETRRTTRALGIGFVAYSPLGRGAVPPRRRAQLLAQRRMRPHAGDVEVVVGSRRFVVGVGPGEAAARGAPARPVALQHRDRRTRLRQPEGDRGADHSGADHDHAHRWCSPSGCGRRV